MKYKNRSMYKQPLFVIAALLLFCTMSTAPAQTAEQIAEKALAATVYLEMKDSTGKTLGFGSGFFVRENLIATNYHVIEGAARGTAKRVGKYTTYAIEGITATDKTNDLAILKVTTYGVKPIPLGNSDTVKIGETVYVAGNPKGLEGTFSDGIISSRRDRYTKERLQMTAPISPGSSGGPVLNKQGEVIGVSVSAHGALDAQNLNFAIPSNYIKTLLALSGAVKPFRDVSPSISAETYFIRGNTKFDLGDYKGAIAAYDEAIRLKPDLAEAYVNRGIAKTLLRQPSAAIVDYNTAIKLKPNYAEAYSNRGDAKERLGQYLAAISDYDIAIKLKPNYAPAYRGRGHAKLELRQHFAAISDYDIAIRLKPDLAEAYSNRGIAKHNLGQYSAAIADYDIAIRLKPDAAAYYNRGLAKAQLNRAREAKPDLRPALRLAEKTGDTAVKAAAQKALQRLE